MHKKIEILSSRETSPSPEDLHQACEHKSQHCPGSRESPLHVTAGWCFPHKTQRRLQELGIY